MTTENPTTNLVLPRGRAYNPWDHAGALGISVVERPIRTALELWMPEFNTIVIRSGLRVVRKRSALAHGIGHAQLAHPNSAPKFEHQADRFASFYLIDPHEFEDVARWASGDYATVCAELNITRRVLDAYLQAG